MQVSNVEEVMFRRGDGCTDEPWWKRPDANAAAAGASATPEITEGDDPHEQESVLSIVSGTREVLKMQRRKNVPSIVVEKHCLSTQTVPEEWDAPRM